MKSKLSSSPDTNAWSADGVLRDYEIALWARFSDDKEEKWKVEGRIKFDILGAGQEIAQVCAVRELRPGDWMRGYYRGMAEALHTGTVSVRESFAQVLGSTEDGADPASGGRMMGRHFGSRLLDDDGEPVDFTAGVNRGSDVSSLASQMGPSLGMAKASRVIAENPSISERFPKLSNAGQEVVHVSIGDSSMAEGIALESLFQAVVQQVPMVVTVYDNGYGISVPSTSQTPHGNVSRALAGLAAGPDEIGARVIGPIHDWDYVECRRAYTEAYEHARSTGQTVLVHAMVTQPRGHSSSGDHRRYKSEERLRFEADKDGIAAMTAWILESGLATEEEIEQIRARAAEHVETEAELAWVDYYGPIAELAREAVGLVEQLIATATDVPASIQTTIETLNAGAVIERPQKFLTRSLILESTRRVLTALNPEAGRADGSRAKLIGFRARVHGDGAERFQSKAFAEGDKSPSNAPLVLPITSDDSPRDTGAHIMAAGMATLMQQDPRVVTFGEDTGSLGGVTTCSLGLQSGKAQVEPNIWKRSPALQQYVPDEGFGTSRVWDSAIAEASIVGMAAGMALRGLRPVAEIQYLDYANYGLSQMIEELGCLRHRTDGGQESPAIVWCQGHRLLGMWHSGSPMGLFMAVAGLRVVVPRNVIQAIGMYRAMITHGRDPAFVVVPLLDLYDKLQVPENLDEICVPLGHSEVLRDGGDVTIITYGHCCLIAQAAAEEVQRDYGVDVEVVDLQTLNPLDLNGVARKSIEKTGRVLFLDEDYPNGAMAMISKTLLQDRTDDAGNQLLYHIECVRTLSSLEHKPCYADDGGYFSKPQLHQIAESIADLWNEAVPRGRSRVELRWR